MMDHFLKTTIRSLLFFCFTGLLTLPARSQKTEKGSSADNPWNREVRDDGYEFTYNSPMTHKASLAFW